MFKSLICILLIAVSIVTIAQDGLNQVVVVNSGQFGNPSERSTLAYFDPVSMQYQIIDTLPSNSIQDIIIEDDFAYVAAQNVILKYDLDSYDQVGMIPFPGVSTHQLEIYNDKLMATNFFGQVMNNLYIFDKHSLAIIDTVEEIVHAGGTMAVYGDKLYVSQNQKGSIDACPPFGCLNDTLGYLSVIDLTTNQWLEDIALENNGDECGRLIRNSNTLFSLNEASNSITAFLPATGISLTQAVSPGINTSRYRTEAENVGNAVVSLFGDGLGVLSEDIMTADVFIDTPVTAFAYDLVNSHFYVIATDFFSFNKGYAFNIDGAHLFDFPVGLNPEAIAVHYNHQPIGTDFETESTDTVLIDVNAISSDPDGDSIFAFRVEDAPVNGIITILPGGFIRYVSLSPGTSDAFRIEVCDSKLNPLCSFISVTILPISGIESSIFNDVAIYPNPVQDMLIIRNPVENATYDLLNSMGATVARFDQPSLDITRFSSGVYYLRMHSEGQQKVLPVLKP